MLGWLTPTTSEKESDIITRYTAIPGELMRFIGGALLLLSEEQNWEQSDDGMTPAEAAELFSGYLEDWYESE
jgi:hypothetical protein